MNVVDIQGHYVELNTLEHLYSPVVSGSSASNGIGPKSAST